MTWPIQVRHNLTYNKIPGNAFGNNFGTKQTFSLVFGALQFMQTLLCRVTHIPLNPYTRIFSITTRPFSQSSSFIEHIERDGARILRTVQKRVNERANILAQISEDMSSPEDIKRAKQAKELEPLREAWDEWRKNRQVRIYCQRRCTDA